MSKNSMMVMVVIAALLVAGLIFVQSRKQEPPTVGQQNSTSVVPNTPVASNAASPNESTPSAILGEVKTFTVVGSNFKLEPNTLKVKKGDKVRIVFKNNEGFHDLVLADFNVATKQFRAVAEEAIEFIASKQGNFEYYCSVGNHRQLGMKGTLTVE